MTPTFILGVGAQKSGTTWLHSTLNEQTFVNLGFRKEYHVWDAKFSPVCSGFVREVEKNESADNALVRLMQTDSDVYVRYFQGLIRDDVTVTGDMTPSYSVLNATDFSYVRDLIIGAGFDLKVLYLMRDPVDRLWSALRMRQRKLAKKRGVTISDDELFDMFLPALEIPRYVERSDYAATTANLAEAFEPDEVHIDLYENIFDRRSIDELERFLGFTIEGADFGNRVHASKQLALPQEVRDEGKQRLREQYDACNERFPLTRELWA